MGTQSSLKGCNGGSGCSALNEIILMMEGRDHCRKTLQNGNCCEFLTDADGNNVHVSPSCEKITGYSQDDFRDNPHLFLTIIHPNHRSQIDRYLQKYFKSKVVYRSDFKIVTRSGNERWIAHLSEPAYSDDGDFVGRYCWNKDITSDKLEELEQYNGDGWPTV